MTQAVSNTTAVVLSLQESLWPRLESVSSNLSNINTPGYKALTTSAHEVKKPTRDGKNVSFVQSNTTFIDNRSGAIQYTGNTYDIAIQGQGYFQVEGGRYTRNGQLQVNTNGQLTTMHGDIVKGEGGSDINVPKNATHVSIQQDGTVTAIINKKSTNIGKLGVVVFDSYTNMTPIGYGLYITDQEPHQLPHAQFMQGAVEASNVEAVSEILRLSELHRLYDQAQKAMEIDDDRQRKVINVGA